MSTFGVLPLAGVPGKPVSGRAGADEKSGFLCYRGVTLDSRGLPVARDGETDQAGAPSAAKGRRDVLALLLHALASGQLKVIDLTTPLGPDTPVIDLPPMFAPSPPSSVGTMIPSRRWSFAARIASAGKRAARSTAGACAAAIAATA